MEDGRNFGHFDHYLQLKWTGNAREKSRIVFVAFRDSVLQSEFQMLF